MKYTEITMDMIANFFGEEEILKQLDEMTDYEIKELIDNTEIDVLYHAIDELDHWAHMIVPYGMHELAAHYGLNLAYYGNKPYNDIWFAITEAREKTQRVVRNMNGTYVYFDQAVELMDEELLEELHFEIAGCTKQQFFTLYEVEHITKFGEEWELSKVNPVY